MTNKAFLLTKKQANRLAKMTRNQRHQALNAIEKKLAEKERCRLSEIERIGQADHKPTPIESSDLPFNMTGDFEEITMPEWTR